MRFVIKALFFMRVNSFMEDFVVIIFFKASWEFCDLDQEFFVSMLQLLELRENDCFIVLLKIHAITVFIFRYGFYDVSPGSYFVVELEKKINKEQGKTTPCSKLNDNALIPMGFGHGGSAGTSDYLISSLSGTWPTG